MSDKEWVNNVAIIAESKEKKQLYIRFEKDITFKKGDRLRMEKKSEAIEKSIKSGKISEEFGEQLLEKTAWIRYDLHKMPNKD